MAQAKAKAKTGCNRVDQAATLHHRKDSVTTQIEALGAVYQHFQEPEKRNLVRKLEETTREMERARMAVEDWRVFGTKQDEIVDNIVDNFIEPVHDILGEGRHNIRIACLDPNTDYRAALTAAHDAMYDAERQLRDNDSDETDED